MKTTRFNHPTVATSADQVSPGRLQQLTTDRRAETHQLHTEPQQTSIFHERFYLHGDKSRVQEEGKMHRSSEIPIQQCQPLLLLLLLLVYSCWISLLTSPSAHRRSSLVAAWIIGKGGERRDRKDLGMGRHGPYQTGLFMLLKREKVQRAVACEVIHALYKIVVGEKAWSLFRHRFYSL